MGTTLIVVIVIVAVVVIALVVFAASRTRARKLDQNRLEAAEHRKQSGNEGTQRRTGSARGRRAG